jgi:hypothetical protein
MHKFEKKIKIVKGLKMLVYALDAKSAGNSALKNQRVVKFEKFF